MNLHRKLGDRHAFGDLFVEQAACDEGADFPLALRKSLIPALQLAECSKPHAHVHGFLKGVSYGVQQERGVTRQSQEIDCTRLDGTNTGGNAGLARQEQDCGSGARELLLNVEAVRVGKLHIEDHTGGHAVGAARK